MKRALIFVHRWLGVGLCLLFLIWFPSGIGIMYWDYPGVSPADRLEHARARCLQGPPFSSGGLCQGWRKGPASIRLNSFDGRPVYRFGPAGIVYADTGDVQTEVSPELMLRVAAAWTGQPADAARIEPSRKSISGPSEACSASARSRSIRGQTGSRCTSSRHRGGRAVHHDRLEARRLRGRDSALVLLHAAAQARLEWSRIVIWTSGIGTFAALLGVVIGLWMYSPSKRYRNAGVATSIPYRGQKRWHTLFGLIFGLGAVTWAFSGMLSMDPFPCRAAAAARASLPTHPAGRARTMGAFAANHPREALAALPADASRTSGNWSSPRLPASRSTWRRLPAATRTSSLSRQSSTAIEHQRIIDIVRTVGRGGLAEIRLLEQYDRITWIAAGNGRCPSSSRG